MAGESGDAARDVSRTLLLVERSDDARDRVGRWLEEAGFDVLTCPGPTGPEYRCVGSRTGGCPLARSAGAVVLDLWLEGDRALIGTGGRGLLRFYRSAGLPVVALTARRETDQRLMDEGVVELAWPPDRRDLVETIRALTRRSGVPPGS